MFWIVPAAVLVVALLVLGIVGYGVFGALSRLGRELEGAERDVRPLLDEVRTTVARANEVADASANRG